MTEQILIAEDEPYIIESLGFVLGQAGFSVTAESDGSAVIRRVREIQPGVVILDLMLPNRNGFEILKELKHDPDLLGTPVLVLTAKGQNQDRSTAKQLGADAFITKPFANREVLQCVQKLLNGDPEPAA
ncbi:MAG TPA: response regulator [Arenicellales bacterium]|nr:response regulator [Arenicellales bacterium]